VGVDERTSRPHLPRRGREKRVQGFRSCWLIGQGWKEPEIGLVWSTVDGRRREEKRRWRPCSVSSSTFLQASVPAWRRRGGEVEDGLRRWCARPAFGALGGGERREGGEANSAWRSLLVVNRVGNRHVHMLAAGSDVRGERGEGKERTSLAWGQVAVRVS